MLFAITIPTWVYVTGCIVLIPILIPIICFIFSWLIGITIAESDLELEEHVKIYSTDTQYKDEFTLTYLVKAINRFFVNASIGIIKNIWNFLYNCPRWIKEFIVECLPWLWRKFKDILNFIFCGRLFSLVWNTLLMLPAIGIFTVVLGWPFIVYMWFYSNIWMIYGGIAWVSCFGIYGAVKGIKNDLVGKIKVAVMSKFVK